MNILPNSPADIARRLAFEQAHDLRPYPALVFHPPESVHEQDARLEREAALALARLRRQEIAFRAAQPLIGDSGDLDQFDILGDGSLWAR